MSDADELSSQAIELDAIRARDAEWRDRHPIKDGPGRDRRWLLQYIGDLEALAEEIARDVLELRSQVKLLANRDGPGVIENSQAPCAVQEKEET